GVRAGQDALQVGRERGGGRVQLPGLAGQPAQRARLVADRGGERVRVVAAAGEVGRTEVEDRDAQLVGAAGNRRVVRGDVRADRGLVLLPGDLVHQPGVAGVDALLPVAHRPAGQPRVRGRREALAAQLEPVDA